MTPFGKTNTRLRPRCCGRSCNWKGVEVQRSGEIVLMYAFKEELWPDAVFSVLVHGSDVRPLHLDD